MKKAKTIGAVELGKLLGRTRERVGQLARDGKIPILGDGTFEVAKAVPAFIAYLDEKAKKSTSSDERIKKARAEKLEIGNEALKRDLIPAEEVRREVTRAFGELKSQLLVIPRRVGQTLALETDPVAIEEKVNAEIVSVLEARSVAELLKGKE